MTGAFVYLALCSIRNGVRLRVRRLRRVRYILITIGMALWVANAIINRPPADLLRIRPEWSSRAQVIAIAIAAIVLALCWVMPGARTLGLTAAEIQFLLPAPITRRQLIAYKLCRLLVPAISTALLLTLVIGPRHAGAAASFAGRTFLVMAMLAFYEAAVALHRQAAEDGTTLDGSQRAVVSLAAAIITAAVAWVLSQVALAPLDELTRVVPLALAMMAANVMWVLGSDAAFEEAATLAADSARRGTAPVAVDRPRPVQRASAFALDARGPFETAILWKNWMLIGRVSRRMLIVGAVLCVAVVVPIVTVGLMLQKSMVPTACYVIAGLAVMLGPVLLRIDLRHDLAHLAVFKTWPVRGAAVIRGELLAPFIAISLVLPLPLLIGSLLDRDLIFDAQATILSRGAFALITLLVGSALILAQLVIQNGIAVTFPGWVSLSPTGVEGGMDRMGQGMVTMYGGMFVLAVALIAPTAAGFALWFMSGGDSSWGRLLLPAMAFTLVLLAECLIATELLGRLFERADLQDLAVSE